MLGNDKEFPFASFKMRCSRKKNYRKLHDYTIAHKDGWNKSCIGLVERVVEGAAAKHNSNGCSSDLNCNS